MNINKISVTGGATLFNDRKARSATRYAKEIPTNAGIPILTSFVNVMNCASLRDTICSLKHCFSTANGIAQILFTFIHALSALHFIHEVTSPHAINFFITAELKI